MAQAIVNLALPIIESKVAEVLEGVMTSTCSPRVAVHELREEVVAYVLRRMPAVYMTTERPQAMLSEPSIHCFSPEQQTRMVELIHEGISHLTYCQSRWQSTVVMATQGIEPAPSHWFG